MGFVKYAQKAEADEAISAMNGHVLKGDLGDKRLLVGYKTNNEYIPKEQRLKEFIEFINRPDSASSSREFN